MQQLSELSAIAAECDRVTKGMLEGQVTRDDGLFATAAVLQRLVNEFAQFVSYSLPIIHMMHKAVLAAQVQQAQAQQPQVQAEQPQVQAEQPPANVVPINPSTDIQVVGGAPGGQRP